MTEPANAPDDRQPNQAGGGKDGGGKDDGGKDGGGEDGGGEDGGRRVVEPLPYDGVASVAVGTGLWLVALLVMLPFADDLEADGNLWWIATAAVGFVLGLAGLRVVVRRRNRLRAATTAPG